MSRPKKWRKVCELPENNLYGPLDSKINNEIIIMSVEEYEAIRLIDLEGMMQEEASLQMNVARTTIQKIYIDARRKLAESLINGKTLKIEGGYYRLCGSFEKPCGRRGCRNNFNDDEKVLNDNNQEELK